MRNLLLAATVIMSSAGVAQAQPYYYGQHYLPPPPYAGSALDYAPIVECKEKSFTIVGARAGATVLDIEGDARAAIKIPLGHHCKHYAPPVAYAAPVYAPPAYPPPAYEGPAYGEPDYPPPPPRARHCGCKHAYRW